VERAKIILGCIDGEAQKLLAQRLGTRPTTISKWRGRFAKFGMKGLEDAPRSGKPKRHIGLREKVLKTLETPPPKGQARWDGLSLAATVGAKKSSIYNILRKDGVHLHRKRSWCVSTDPEFAAKAADIIGLYLQPPTRALVLSVDEKPSIQALSRTIGYVQTSSGKIVRGLKSHLQTQWHAESVCGVERRHWRSDQEDDKDKNPDRLPSFHGRSRQRRGRRSRDPRHSRQLRHTQEKWRLVESASERDVSLHPDIGVVAQPN